MPQREESEYGMSPDQLNGGIKKLWKAIGVTGVQDEDVFTMAAKKIEHLRRQLACASENFLDAERCRIELLRETIVLQRAAECEYWRWQGDGTDHLESLTAPVLIDARTLAGFIEKAGEQ